MTIPLPLLNFPHGRRTANDNGEKKRERKQKNEKRDTENNTYENNKRQEERDKGGEVDVQTRQEARRRERNADESEGKNPPFLLRRQRWYSRIAMSSSLVGVKPITQTKTTTR